MNQKIKNTLKYVFIFAITFLLLWYVWDSIEPSNGETRVEFLLKVWDTANKPFLFLSGLMAVLSHALRAARWKLLLNPLNYRVKFIDSFISVMIGYFVNLAIPRGGELSRCYSVYKSDKVPVDVSLGTVISERVIDLIFLILLIAAAFLVEIDTLTQFFQEQSLTDAQSKGGGFPFLKIAIFLGLLALAGITSLYLLFKYKRRLSLKIWSKIKGILTGLKNGLMVVFKLEHNVLFIVYSLSIWILYYLMLYFVLIAFPETSTLSLMEALTIFVIGGIAMALPLPGGAGSYHTLVPAGLIILYAIDADKAKAFTIIFHGWQTLILIIFGVISMLLAQYRQKIKRNGHQK